MPWYKPFEHKFKDIVFSLYKVLLRKRDENVGVLDPKSLNKILFLRPDKIGDMVISLPVFDNLKKAYPHLKFGLLCTPRNLPLIKDDPRFEKIYLYRKRFFKDVKEVRRMRGDGYDAVVDLICYDSITTLFLANYAVKSKPRVGLQKFKYKNYFEISSYRKYDNLPHIVRHTLDILSTFGLDPDKASGYAAPFIDQNSQVMAEDFIKGICRDEVNKVNIGINLSVGRPNRVWALEKYRQIVEKILSHYNDFRIIIFTAPPDRHLSEVLVSKFAESVYQVPSGLNLIGACAILSKMALLITPDTSMTHIARSFKIPIVGLYSDAKKNFKHWHPYEQIEGAVISSDEDNLYDITIDEVYAKFETVISQIQKVPS